MKKRDMRVLDKLIFIMLVRTLLSSYLKMESLLKKNNFKGKEAKEVKEYITTTRPRVEFLLSISKKGRGYENN